MIELARLSAAERLLWGYGVTAAEHIDLEAIAQDHGAAVVYRRLDGCAARLVATSDRAIISIDNSSTPGRRRFSLGHELAHWIVDRHKGTFLCAADDISARDTEKQSIEARANDYASQLILPDYLVVPWMEGKRPTLTLARSLAKQFGASLTAAAIKMAKRAAVPACVMCHRKAGRAWFQMRAGVLDGFYLNPELHHDTDAFAMVFGAGPIMSAPRRGPGDIWLSGKDAVRRVVETQSAKLPDETVLTMLTVVS